LLLKQEHYKHYKIMQLSIEERNSKLKLNGKKGKLNARTKIDNQNVETQS